MTRPTSQKLDDLHRALDRAIDANHAHEIRDDIRREEEHLRTCPYAKSERDIDEYDRLLKIAADIIDATARALGIPKAEEGKVSILKAIGDLKTRADKGSQPLRWVSGEGLLPPTPGTETAPGTAYTATPAGLVSAIDRLLDAHKAPRRYDTGDLLTREERLSWLERKATP